MYQHIDMAQLPYIIFKVIHPFCYSLAQLFKRKSQGSKFLPWLVVEPPLWKIWKSNGIIVPNIWENKSHVPNHQPVFLFLSHWLVSLCSRYQNSNLPVPSCLIRPAYSPRLSSVTRVSLPLWWCKCTYTGWWFQPLWKIWVCQWEGLSHILWKITFMFQTTNQYMKHLCVCVSMLLVYIWRGYWMTHHVPCWWNPSFLAKVQLLMSSVGYGLRVYQCISPNC